MILKLMINLVRWSWGFPSLAADKIDDGVFLLMMFGTFIDIAALIGLVCLALLWWDGRKGGAK